MNTPFYTPWNVNDEEYKLRLTRFNAVQVEKQLGMGLTEAVQHLADTTVIITLLWGGLQQFNHGFSFKDVCELYDEYLESGGNIEKIIDVIMELLAQVGIGEKPERKNKKSQKAEPDTEI
jgi:hypothetical protein